MLERVRLKIRTSTSEHKLLNSDGGVDSQGRVVSYGRTLVLAMRMMT